MQYIPTRPAIQTLGELNVSWPQLVNDLDHAEHIVPARGFESRLLMRGQLVAAFVEPGIYDGEPARFVVGVRPRHDTRTDPELANVVPVVGVETPAVRSTRRGGRGSVWPGSWQELMARLGKVEGITVRHGAKHLAVLRNGDRIATLPVSGSDHRGLRNACTQLRARGVDVSLAAAAGRSSGAA